MARVIAIPDMPAADDLMALIKLMQDPEGYKSLLERMLQMKHEVNALVELVGPASDILTLRGQAAADKEAAAQLRNAAEEDARVIVEEAKQQKADTDRVCRAKKSALDAREKAIQQAEDKLTQEMMDYTEHKERENARLASLVDEAEKAKAAAEEAKALYEGKIAALNAAMKAA